MAQYIISYFYEDNDFIPTCHFILCYTFASLSLPVVLSCFFPAVVSSSLKPLVGKQRVRELTEATTTGEKAE